MNGPALHAGLTAEASHVVAPTDTAVSVGSGSLPVLATPRLVAWLEAATCAAVEGSLSVGMSSVGTRLGLEHVRPSVVGAGVTCTARLVHVDGRLLRFEVVATDSGGALVAHGEVTRVVVDGERFLARAAR